MVANVCVTGAVVDEILTTDEGSVLVVGAGLDESWVAGTVAVAVDGVAGFGGVVVAPDPLIALAAPVTSDEMADGDVLTPRAPTRCDPNAKRTAKAATAETRKIASQKTRRVPPNVTFLTG